MREIFKTCFKFGFWGAVVYSLFVYFLFLLSYANKNVDFVARVMRQPTIYIYEQMRDLMMQVNLISTTDDWVSYVLFLPAWVFLFGFVSFFTIAFSCQSVALLVKKVHHKGKRGHEGV